MRKVFWIAVLLFAAGLFLGPTTSAQAQATRTWVSGVGDDANPCSRTAPCKTFAGAISKTAAGGEISVLDPGGFGAVTITKSISLIQDSSGEAGILASGTNGIVINAAATDVILLHGLVIDGGTAASPGLNGVRFLAGGALHVQKSIIKNFNGAAPNGNGILFAPSGTSELYVDDSFLSNNGNGAQGAGIFVQPTGAGIARVSVDNTRMENNGFGFVSNTTTTTGSISAAIFRSVAAGNTNTGFAGGSAAVGGIANNIMISQSEAAFNTNGITANGSGVTIRIGGSSVVGNTTLGVNILNGGTVLSYKNNQINGNASDGTPLTGIGAASPAFGLN